MKLESLVIAGQTYCGEYVLKSCTHRPSTQGRWERPKSHFTVGLRRVHRQGVSRNKARVAEAARGIFQFENGIGTLRRPIPYRVDFLDLDRVQKGLSNT